MNAKFKIGVLVHFPTEIPHTIIGKNEVKIQSAIECVLI